MSKPGKPRRTVPTRRWDLYIREDLAAKVELLLADPMRERVKYGERSKLIETLLEDWLNRQVRGQIVAVKPSISQLELLIDNGVKMNIRPDGMTEMLREWAEKLGLLNGGKDEAARAV